MNRDHADKGFIYISGTSVIPANAYGFTALVATVIDEIVYDTNYEGDADIEGVSLPAGYYPMQFTSIQLTSGSGIAWLKA